MPAKKVKLTFEEALTRLSEIIDEMESDATPLKKSAALYKEGAELAALCSKEIGEAEAEVKVIRKNIDGGIEIEGFDEI